MIPVAQLDPASLCLWYDPEMVSAAEGGEIFADAVHQATFRDLEATIAAINKAPDAKTKIRAVHLVSSIWHEYRHFLDLVLTNYGAFRLRLFTSIYTNTDVVLNQLISLGEKLVCPIDVYLDPVRAEMLGAQTKSDALLAVAANIAARKEWLQDDLGIISSPQGLMATGGEAQLEALAYFCQIAAVQEIFGAEMGVAIQNDLPIAQRSNLRYRWAAVLASRGGLLSFTKKDGLRAADISLLCPMLLGSLICRKYGQEQSLLGSSGFPFARFGALAKELSGKLVAAGGMDVVGAWELVNQASKKLWGVTIVDELDSDYAKEAEWIEKIHKSDSVHPTICSALDDLHALRGRLIALLNSDPGAIIDPFQFTRDLLFRLSPIPIVASRSGQLGKPPEGWARVLGFKDPEFQGPQGQWWWAAGPEKWSFAEESFALKDKNAWLTIVSDSAPLAKLWVNGRTHRTMLSPELLSVEMRLQHEGVKIAFDPIFRFPAEINEIKSFFELTGKNEAICDFCRNPVKKPEGYLVSPWVFRYKEENADLCIKGFGGGQLGQLRFRKDWSPWLFCEACRKQFGFNTSD